jgi:hypothetical protein
MPELRKSVVGTIRLEIYNELVYIRAHVGPSSVRTYINASLHIPMHII